MDVKQYLYTVSLFLPLSEGSLFGKRGDDDFKSPVRIDVSICNGS